MEEKVALHTLMECLRNHELSFDQDEIKQALQSDNGSVLSNWIIENLGVETLLSKEELQLYTELEKSGQLGDIASQDLTQVRPIHDEEIRHATSELRRSTIAIEKQMATLKDQQEATSASIRDYSRDTALRTATNGAQFRMWRAELARVKIEIEELMRNLSYHLNQLDSQAKVGITNLNHAAAAIFKDDDKLIATFPKLTHGLEAEGSEGMDVTDYLRGLCTRLIKYTVEGVRARLDRIYLEALLSPGIEGSQSQDEAEVIALREEMESLYSEILPVAQMSVEQEYLEPGLRSISVGKSKKTANTRLALEHVSHSLTLLLNRLENLLHGTIEYQSYCQMNSLLSTIIRNEIDTPIPESPSRTSNTMSVSPSRRRPKTVSPARQRTLARRRSSASSLDEEIAPGQQLLRHLGISSSSDSTDVHALAATLQDSIVKRGSKMKAHEQNLHLSLQNSIGTHVHDAQITLNLLRDALLSNTSKKSVRLSDEEVDAAIENLERDLRNITMHADGISLEILRQRCAKKDAIVDRWTR